MTILNVYLIHSEHLTNRIKYINSTIDMIKQIGEKLNYIVNIKSVKEPSKDFIDDNIDKFNARVDYAKEENGDEQFNNVIGTLNSCQISNIEKHKQIFKHIKNKDEIHFILEDDVVINKDYIDNIEEAFKYVGDNRNWDIVFTCLACIDSESLSFVDSRSQYKFLLSKSSYFINPETALKLDNFLEIYKYNLKNSISKFIWDNKNIQSFVFNKHTFLEGSKMGFFPSSVNNNNFLFQNINFINMTKISNSSEITDDMLAEAQKIFLNVSNLDNPDFYHAMGIIYYKRGDYENAKKMMTDACISLEKNKGYYSKSSEILNNTVNIYKYDQKLLKECSAKKSKYS